MNFVSTEAAESVLQALSRHPRWRSNVSFAKVSQDTYHLSVTAHCSKLLALLQRETVVSPVEKPRTLGDIDPRLPRGFDQPISGTPAYSSFSGGFSPFDISQAKLPAHGTESTLFSAAAPGFTPMQRASVDFLQPWGPSTPAHGLLEHTVSMVSTALPVASTASAQSRF